MDVSAYEANMTEENLDLFSWNHQQSVAQRVFLVLRARSEISAPFPNFQ